MWNDLLSTILYGAMAVTLGALIPKLWASINVLCYYPVMLRKRGKMKGVRWLVPVKSQIIGHWSFLDLNPTYHWQILTECQQAQFLLIASRRWAPDGQSDQ